MKERIQMNAWTGIGVPAGSGGKTGSLPDSLGSPWEENQKKRRVNKCRAQGLGHL